MHLNPKRQHAAIVALVALCDTVEATGGIINYESDAELGLAVDPEWLDLASVYVQACHVLNRPVVHS